MSVEDAATPNEKYTHRSIKERVREYWDARPIGTADVTGPDPFAALDERRYSLEPFIERFARFEERRGQRVLDVGCGTGGDLLRFARAGADAHGVDVSPRTVALARRRFEVAGLTANVQVADAESLPFPDRSFDLVWSWGVLHHTPDTSAAVAEVRRVCRGEAVVMLYHRHSLFALQAWLRYGAFRKSLARTIAEHIESPGTKAYSIGEMRRLFPGWTVEAVVTPWDLRAGRRLFLPRWTQRLVPPSLGWFLVAVGGRRV